LSYVSAIPARQEGRSYVVTNAGWVAVDAGGVKAVGSVQGEMTSWARYGPRRRTAPKLCGAFDWAGPCPAKPLGEAGSARVRRNRVVLAVVATVKPWRRRQSRQPARCRAFREGEGGQNELGSRESTA